MDLTEGDIVQALCKGTGTNIPAEILSFNKADGTAYVRFKNQDNRLDEWKKLTDLTFISHAGKDSHLKKKKKEYGERYINQMNPIRNVETIQFGPYTINCWYYSPYGSKYTTKRHLYICDICCKYFDDPDKFYHHGHPIEHLRPPGHEIYRNGDISLFEVNGAYHKLFCQRLSLLSKLFLNDVAIFYNVSQFYFYVVCLNDTNGAHVVSFFSRDCRWLDNNILACIMVLPPYQNHGYGRLMISIAYEIARRNGIVGGPEKPLSDLGKLAFASYWKHVIIETLFVHREKIQTVDDIVTVTSIAKTDILKCLKDLNLVYKTNEGWTTTLNAEAIKERVEHGERPSRPKLEFNPDNLIWLPEDFKLDQEEEDQTETKK